MATDQTLMWRRLPPVGNRVALFAGGAASYDFPGYRTRWLDSGTAALALAIREVCASHESETPPEVILPAYGCPDLVAATVYAGARPVLVDIGDSDPGYDIDKLLPAIRKNTVAVVAVNFLGIRERLSHLRTLLNRYPGVRIIEDSAQWFPEPATALESDFVCLSFGRGKPVSLMGGGALLVRHGVVTSEVENDEAAVHPWSRIKLLSKLMAYNVALSPLLYRLVYSVPFGRLGTTSFRPLRTIDPMTPMTRTLLARNVRRHLLRPIDTQQLISQTLSAGIDLPKRLADRCGRLLRYPVILRDRASRDRKLRMLRSAGLGATPMYGRPLAQIAGVEPLVTLDAGDNQASTFADRLLTLPVHQGVTSRDVHRMMEILRSD